MTRRILLSSLSLVSALPSLITAESNADPWTAADLIEPAQLAAAMKNGSQPHVICVAFPVLYRTRHIAGAEFAGPTSKPEGLASLQHAAAQFPKNADIVLYCGCCPMVRCPNIRPAYRSLKESGFKQARVLALSTGFHQDWEAKGYPVQPLN